MLPVRCFWLRTFSAKSNVDVPARAPDLIYQISTEDAGILHCGPDAVSIVPYSLPIVVVAVLAAHLSSQR